MSAAVKVGRTINQWATSLVNGTVLLAFGGMLGALVGLFGTKGAAAVPAAAVGILMMFVPYSALYAIVAIVPVNIQFTDTVTVSRLVVVVCFGIIAFQTLVRRIPAPSLLPGPGAATALVFFTAIIVTSLSFGVSGLLGRVGQHIIYAVIFFVVLNYADHPERFRRVLWVVILMGLVQGVLVMLEALYDIVPFSGWQQELAESRGSGEVRVVGMHAHPIWLAAFFQVAMVAGVGLLLTSRQRIVVPILIGLLGLFVVSWWYTFARSSWIGMVVVIVGALMMYSRALRFPILAGSLFALVLLATYDFSVSAIIQDVESLANLQSSRDRAGVATGSTSLQWRLENWSAAVSMFLEHPLTGVGMTQSKALAFHFLPLGASAHTHIGAAEPHNMFLQLAAEGGIVTVTAFIVLWVLAFRAVRQALGSPALRAYAFIVLAMMGVVFTIFFLNPMSREVWLVLALALVLGRMRRREVEREAATGSPSRT